MGKVLQPDGTIVNITNHVPRETKENKDSKPAASVSDPAAVAPGEAPKEPVKPVEKPTDKEVAADAKAEVLAEAGFEPGDKIPDDVKAKIQKRINAKHRAMVEAQEAADEAERFAENQYNERVLAEKRAEAAERRAQELEGKTQPETKSDELVKPTPDDRNSDGTWKYRDATGNIDWDKYTDAKADYAAEKKHRDFLAQQDEEKASKERAAFEERVKTNVDRARAFHADFDQVMKSVPPEADRVPQWVLNYLGESDDSGFVAYHLAKHPEDRQRIVGMKPIPGIRELGKLEEKLSAERAPPKQDKVDPPPPVAHQRGGAPPPITPLDTGSASLNKDPAKMSYKELRAYERDRMRR